MTDTSPEQHLAIALSRHDIDWDHWLSRAAYYAGRRQQCDPALSLARELVRHVTQFAPDPAYTSVYGTLAQLGLESLDWVAIAEIIHREYFLTYYHHTSQWPCPWYGTAPAPCQEDLYE